MNEERIAPVTRATVALQGGGRLVGVSRVLNVKLEAKDLQWEAAGDGVLAVRGEIHSYVYFVRTGSRVVAGEGFSIPFSREVEAPGFDPGRARVEVEQLLSDYDFDPLTARFQHRITVVLRLEQEPAVIEADDEGGPGDEEITSCTTDRDIDDAKGALVIAADTGVAEPVGVETGGAEAAGDEPDGVEPGGVEAVGTETGSIHDGEEAGDIEATSDVTGSVEPAGTSGSGGTLVDDVSPGIGAPLAAEASFENGCTPADEAGKATSDNGSPLVGQAPYESVPSSVTGLEIVIASSHDIESAHETDGAREIEGSPVAGAEASGETRFSQVRTGPSPSDVPEGEVVEASPPPAVKRKDGEKSVLVWKPFPPPIES